MALLERVQDCVSGPAGACVVERRPDGFCSLADDVVRDSDCVSSALRAHEPHEIRIRHGCYRMMTHPGFIERIVAHEEVPTVDRSAVDRQSGDHHSEVEAEIIEECVRDGSDVPLCCAVEGRAILEHEPFRARSAQRSGGFETRVHGLTGRRRTCLQADDDGFGFRDFGGPQDLFGGRLVELDGTQPGRHQESGDVGGAGEIVRDDSQAKLHVCTSRGHVNCALAGRLCATTS